MKDEKILFNFCRLLFYLGLGDFWFKSGIVGNTKSWLYRTYCGFLYIMAFLIVGMQILAGLFGDFPKEIKQDAITLSISHGIDVAKVWSVFVKKAEIKQLTKDIIKLSNAYECDEEMKRKFKSIKFNCIAYFVMIVLASAFYIFESTRKVLLYGEPYITIVTYYPAYENRTVQAEFLRITSTVIVMYLLLLIVWVDNFAVTFLIIIKYKFLTLGSHFENITNSFKDDRSDAENTKIFKDKFVQGVVMHQELLRITKDTNKVFGVLFSLHLCLSYGSVVSMLLSIALAQELRLTYVVKVVLFIVALIFLLALFMCNAGEITYQASQLSMSIYKCGWECRGREVAQLVMIAGAACRKAVALKAFVIFDLTYSTFITVVRGIYSVFTLLLHVQQDK